MEIIIFKLSDNGCGNNTTVATFEPNTPTENTVKSEPRTGLFLDPRLPTEQTIKNEPTSLLPSIV